MKIDNKIYFAPGVEFKDVDWNDPHGLVELFRARVLAYYISSAQSMYETVRAREADNYRLLGIAFGSGLICCTTIDFLARFEFDRLQVGDRYRAWLEQYISGMNRIDPDNRQSTVANRFYKEFRNGLVHHGRIKNAGQFSLDADTFDEPGQIFTFVECALVVHPFNLFDAVELRLHQYCNTLHDVPADLTVFAVKLKCEFQADIDYSLSA